MNIVYTTDEAFTAKVAAGICSVFENNKEMEQINVYIVGQNLSETSCKRFEKIAEKYKRNIFIIPLGKIEDYLDFEYDTGGWNAIVLARLFLEKLLPETVEKVIYLDGDTINIGSLKKMWNTDMHEKVVGAWIEATISSVNKKILHMENIPYVNAGVLLIDLKLWREQAVGRKILQFYCKNNGKLPANDQDAINGTLKENIYYLKPEYNFYNIYWFYPYKVLKKLMGNTEYYSKNIVENAKKHPIIIHYLGEERPWRAGNHHPYKSDYYRYLRLTPWKDEKDEEGWKIYFILWDIFNFVMKPFPEVRYKIINSLIPQFMKWRKKQIKREK